MANIQLIKDILSDKANDYTIYDIFSENELEYADEILIYTLDSFEFDIDADYYLNDCMAREEEGIDDNEHLTDEIRFAHGLRYFDDAIAHRFEAGNTMAEDIHMYQVLNIDGNKIYICYDAFCEVHGMGSYVEYENATLVGIFESYNELKQHYKDYDYYIFDDACDAKCLEEKKKYILEWWDKDSIETETPKEIEDRLAIEYERKEKKLIKKRVSALFKVYTTPISVVEIGKTIPKKLKKFDSFVIIYASDRNLNNMGVKANKTMRYDRLKDEGMKMYFATASGGGFKWSKKCTRCLLNVSKEEAIDFIQWSDSHFGVWYDGSVPIILYV